MTAADHQIKDGHGGNLFVPSDSDNTGLKTDERLELQRQKLFRMSSEQLIVSE